MQMKWATILARAINWTVDPLIRESDLRSFVWKSLMLLNPEIVSLEFVTNFFFRHRVATYEYLSIYGYSDLNINCLLFRMVYVVFLFG